MNIKTIAAAVLLGGAAISPAQAQDNAQAAATGANRLLTPADLEGLRAELRSSRKQVMAQTLRLTDDEATRFWPVYDRFQHDLTEIKDDQYELVAEYANTYGRYDDAKAEDYIKRWLDLDAKVSALRAQYVPLVNDVLPGPKATTFFQIDRRVSMYIDQRIESLLPLLQYQAELTQAAGQ